MRLLNIVLKATLVFFRYPTHELVEKMKQKRSDAALDSFREHATHVESMRRKQKKVRGVKVRVKKKRK